MSSSLSQTFTRIHTRLVQRRLLTERQFGQPGLLYRALHIRPSTGLILSLPAFAICLWYSGLSVAIHLRHNEATESKEPLSLGLFHLHLHDRVVHDYQRSSMPEPTGKSQLPTYGLVLSNDKLDQLDSKLPPEEGQSTYIDATLTQGNQIYQVQVRYRGSKHWHWNHPQKSWKVRVNGEELMFEGLPTFNFINTPDPVPFYEEMILDVAQEEGLLTPAYYPFRMSLNNAYMGVYFFEAQVDEGLLRQSNRMPGSIFSGASASVDEKTQTGKLFTSSVYWKKVATTTESDTEDMGELSTLLHVLNESTDREFSRFASESMDVNKFLKLDAIDVVFGLNQHDYNQNHKLYFDPYRGRFEPIGMDFRDPEHERVLNRTENPWLVRLKQLPSYVTDRNREVYRLIRERCSEKVLRTRAERHMALLEVDQLNDPYWDAYELLPVMGTYYRQMLRPMTRDIQAERANARLDEFGQRARFLAETLSTVQASASLIPLATMAATNRHPAARGAKRGTGVSAKPKPTAGSVAVDQGNASETASSQTSHLTVLDVAVDGEAGMELNEVTPIWSDGCRATRWDLVKDRNLDGALDTEPDAVLLRDAAPTRLAKLELALYPGVVQVPRTPDPFRGSTYTVPEVRHYRFLVHSVGCAPAHVRLAGKSLVTGNPIALDAGLSPSGTTLQPLPGCTDSPFVAEAGRRSLHPWCWPEAAPETVQIGPGQVDVNETRFYRANQTVVIEPGTTLLMAAGTSLIFEGKVVAEGRADAPIRILPLDGSWGGIALRGAQTRGSRFQFVEFRNGTVPTFGMTSYPGMVNVHDTADIRFSDAHFSGNRGSDDALHAVYVDGFSLTNVHFDHVAADAVDIEFSTAEIAGYRAVDVGDDGLDIMGSRVSVKGVEVVGCVGNGLSIGERTEVKVDSTLVTGCTNGLLVKNASSATLEDTLLYRNDVGVRLEPEDRWYPGTSHVRGETIHIVGCKQLLTTTQGRTLKALGNVIDRLPESDLPELKNKVLGLRSWQELDSHLNQMRGGGKP